MKIEPMFQGKIKITQVKNEKWSWFEFDTKKSDDKKLFAMAKKICIEEGGLSRHFIPTNEGKAFKNLLERIINTKIDLPSNKYYSMNRTQNHILFFNGGQYDAKKLDKYGLPMIDRTGIDIFM